MLGESETDMTMQLSDSEAILLKELVLTGIGNGNTVNPKPFVPTPDQYIKLHSIMKSLREQAAG